MSDLSNYIKKQMENPEFANEYLNSENEYFVAKALISARINSNLTQKELAEKSGIKQSNISRIENSSCSPTVATLSALAKGLGKKLVISFE